MKKVKSLLISIFSAVVVCVFVSVSEAKVPHRVTAQIEGAYLTPYYTITNSWVTYDKGIAYIGIDTQGDCRTHYIPKCYDHFDPPNYRWHECYDVPHVYCRNERGYFALPVDKIIYDGKTRLKYIENGSYVTIARWEGIPFFKSWHLRDHVKIAVGPDLLEASLLIFEP